MTRRKQKIPSRKGLEKQIRKGGLSENENAVSSPEPGSLRERLQKIGQLTSTNEKKPKSEMLCFVMYDIQNNKFRTKVAHYLEEKGCHRIQKSVFLAQIPRKRFLEMYQTLIEMNEQFEGEDSIFLVPVSEDDLFSTKVIGQEDYFDLVMFRKHTTII